MNIQKEYIFETDKYFNACHASTLLKLSDGSVLAAWFAGTREGNDDVRIWYAKKSGNNWSEPKCLETGKDLPHWNPVLLLRKDGSVRLFYKTGKKISHWVTEYCDSFDGGESWTKPEILVKDDNSGGRGPVKNKCIRTSEGILLAPASTEQNKQWRCFIDISDDDGDSWHKQQYIVRPRKLPTGLVKMIQPALWEDEKGIIHALMRSDKGFIYYSRSKDGGRKWTKAEKTDIPNNNSGIDCVKADDGNIYLVCNPVGENWGARSPLSLMKSEDNGKSFSEIAVLEDRKDGEFSYPAIIAQGDKLYVTYTYDRKNIVYCEVEP
ncbi:MAG: exo-alpha-sialidase [Clostridia bacterium]|nr:exo-alpha-sialidase [Clostridia bacterium]